MNDLVSDGQQANGPAEVGADEAESDCDDIIYRTEYFYVTRRPNLFEVQLLVDPTELTLQ